MTSFAAAKTFVFGGDIFDFRWSVHGSVERTLAVGLEWFENLLATNPECHVHYLLGNHDCLPELSERLVAMSRQDSRLHVHEFFLRMGDTIFLHGEPADFYTDQQQLENRRQKFKRHEKKSRFSNVMYDLAVQLRLHKLINYIVHPDTKVAARLIHYLNSVEAGPETGIKRVYFGHTHRAVDGFEYDGIRFYNGGAPMKGLEFKILTIEWDSQ